MSFKMKTKSADESEKAQVSQKSPVDWTSMSDRKLGWNAECFELHGERIPRELQRELDKRHSTREYDPMGSVEEFQRSERLLGA